MSQIKAEISLRTNAKLNFHKNVGLQWYQWIPDFYNIRFEQNNFTEKNYVQTVEIIEKNGLSFQDFWRYTHICKVVVRLVYPSSYIYQIPWSRAAGRSPASASFANLNIIKYRFFCYIRYYIFMHRKSHECEYYKLICQLIFQ